MVFVGGALAGVVLGLGAGALLQRRAGRPNFAEGRGLATTVALIALLVAAVALANSGRARDRGVVAAAAASTPTAPPHQASTSTTTSRPADRSSGLVTVPNVERIARAEAVTKLERAGLKVTIESLPLSNVPAGFVISQSPLPNALTTAGATVTLVVSAAA